MSIGFKTIPANIRIPFVAVEFDNSQASQGPAQLPYRVLLIGQKTGGSAASNSLQLVSNADQVLTAAGRGSQLHRKSKRYFQNNQFTETWIGVLADHVSGVGATAPIVFSGTATASGTLYLYIGGEQIPVPISVGDTASTVAGNVASAIGKHASGTVTFSSADPADNITVAGTTEGGESVSVTFVGTTGTVTAGDATYSIDTGNSQAAASFAAQVNAHADASKLVRASASSAVTTLRAVQGGVGGNSIALTSTDGVDTALSGATLTGGAAGQSEDLPVHASVSTATVTVRAKNAGLCGNDIDIRLNYRAGETTPTGISALISAMSGGATNPSLTLLLAEMGDRWFQVICEPFTDATSLTALEAEMLSRSGPMRMIDGQVITSAAGAVSALGTLGDSRNSQFVEVWSQPGKNPLVPPCEFAAGVAGALAYYAPIDPALPFQTLPILGMLPPAERDLFTNQERNQLLYDGISTTKSNSSQVTIERACTTYQRNAAGAEDESFYDANTMFTLLYLRYSFRNWIQSHYPRAKLMDDDRLPPAGQSVITEKIGGAEACSWFRAMEDLGLVENFAQFKRDLLVQRDPTNRNRLNFLLPPDIVNQFIVGGVQIQFRK